LDTQNSNDTFLTFSLPMELIGIGIDIVDLARIRAARYPQRLAEYILNEEELRDLEMSGDQNQFLASRLAAKEAVIKASPLPITYHDIIIGKRGDQPIVSLLRIETAHLRALISLSHTAEYAIGSASVLGSSLWNS